MRRVVTVLIGLLSALVVCGTAGAAEERLLVTDPADGAEADLREVRLTRTAAGALTLVVRFDLEVAPDGPRVDVVLGATPEQYGSGCLPRAAGNLTVALAASDAPQRATARRGATSTRPIVWPGVDARELVVHLPAALVAAADIACVAATATGDPADVLGPSVPEAGLWPLLRSPRENVRTGRLTVRVDSELPPVRVRFQTALFAGPSAGLEPSGPWRALPTALDRAVSDARARAATGPVAWRAIAVDDAGAAYSEPRVVRFADTSPPLVAVQPASVLAGRPLAIRGSVVDDSGRASVVVTWQRGSTVLATVRSARRAVGAEVVLARFGTSRVQAGASTVCVVATDRAGNRSRRACAAVTVRVPAPVAPPTPPPPTRQCDPSYPSMCLPPGAPDLDCDDVGQTDFPVRPPDPHGFDGNGDGVGCES